MNKNNSVVAPPSPPEPPFRKVDAYIYNKVFVLKAGEYHEWKYDYNNFKVTLRRFMQKNYEIYLGRNKQVVTADIKVETRSPIHLYPGKDVLRQDRNTYFMPEVNSVELMDAPSDYDLFYYKVTGELIICTTLQIKHINLPERTAEFVFTVFTSERL